MLTIMERLNEIAENFKGWIMANQNNALLWVGLFVGGLLLFFYTYNALNKNK